MAQNSSVEWTETKVFQMEADFEQQVADRFDQILDEASRSQSAPLVSADSSTTDTSARP